MGLYRFTGVHAYTSRSFILYTKQYFRGHSTLEATAQHTSLLEPIHSNCSYDDASSQTPPEP